MTRKIGIVLICWFVCQLVFMILFFENLTNEVVRASLFISLVLLFPIAFALLFLRAELTQLNRARRIYLGIAILLIGAGLIFRFLQLPSASIQMIVGVFWYCFAYAPLEFRYKYNKWKPFSSGKLEILLLSSINFIAINALLLGCLFKIMTWKGGFVFLVVGIIFALTSTLLWNYKFRTEIVLRKQSEEKVKEAFKEITDSINYAKRIQEARLPSMEQMKSVFAEHFVLFSPKDVVSGDFYFFRIEAGHFFVAAADCTGHGVPGAFMSMIGSEKLDEALKNTSQPGEMLSYVNREIKRSLQQDESENATRDGMDIVLCSIDPNTGKLLYSAANRPLWILRKDADDIEEIKGTKRAIGGLTPDDQVFEQHEVICNSGDRIYLFSDGYVDTFGGPNDKKLTNKRLRELILKNKNMTLSAQKDILHEFVNDWKGELGQVDDILVIALQFP